ncbi:MAG: SurA N-terminal domain-containing protein [Burkholderiales bacterium]|jgi:peptidyl-prolyl cis-trans isomerase D|nr:SurA N-terminal domain-containing protein [Burkholderiales bacterium]
MFNSIKRSKILTPVVIVIIIVPLLFWGIDSFFRGVGAEGDVAKVGKNRISSQVFEDRLREQQEIARQQLGEQYDSTMFSTPEARFAVLNQMITENILLKKATDDYFRVSDQKVFDTINSIPAFQENGQFSSDLYRQVLLRQSRPMSPTQFEHLVRSEFLKTPLTEPIQAGELNAFSAAERYHTLAGERREVVMASLEIADFAKQVKISDEDIETYYMQNPQAFQSPETVSIEYVKLSRAALLGKITLTDEQIRESYERDQKRYEQSETRDAAHILIAVPRDAGGAQKTEALKKAEDILDKLKAAPDTFAALAKEFSQDPGSAAHGGELGAITVGGFDRAFVKAVFDAKESGIVGPVETEFGYHIIKVTIQSAKQLPFDEVKSKIENDLRQNEANTAYAEKAAEFMNMVHEQIDSFDELSNKLEIPVSKAEFLTRAQVAQLADGNQQLAEAVFSPASLRDRQNTDPIEVGSETIISARVVAHKPITVRPLEDVKAQIKILLENRKAFELVRAAGEEKLAQLQQGKSAKDVGLTFGKPTTIGRQQQQPGFTADAHAEVFRREAGKLPTYLGAAVGQSRYTIYRVEKILPSEAPDAAQKLATAEMLSEMKGREALKAYLQNLRDSTKVEINQAKLDSAR